MAYVTMDVSPIENATTKQRIDDTTNALLSYRIYPNEGYVLHDNQYDQPIYDDETGEETGGIMLGYIPYPSFVTVGNRYDFEENERQLYCVPADTVPENQIFGGVDKPEHEIM